MKTVDETHCRGFVHGKRKEMGLTYITYICTDLL